MIVDPYWETKMMLIRARRAGILTVEDERALTRTAWRMYR